MTSKVSFLTINYNLKTIRTRYDYYQQYFTLLQSHQKDKNMYNIHSFSSARTVEKKKRVDYVYSRLYFSREKNSVSQKLIKNS